MFDKNRKAFFLAFYVSNLNSNETDYLPQSTHLLLYLRNVGNIAFLNFTIYRTIIGLSTRLFF